MGCAQNGNFFTCQGMFENGFVLLDVIRIGLDVRVGLLNWVGAFLVFSVQRSAFSVQVIILCLVSFNEVF